MDKKIKAWWQSVSIREKRWQARNGHRPPTPPAAYLKFPPPPPHFSSSLLFKFAYFNFPKYIEIRWKQKKAKKNGSLALPSNDGNWKMPAGEGEGLTAVMVVGRTAVIRSGA